MSSPAKRSVLEPKQCTNCTEVFAHDKSTLIGKVTELRKSVVSQGKQLTGAQHANAELHSIVRVKTTVERHFRAKMAARLRERTKFVKAVYSLEKRIEALDRCVIQSNEVSTGLQYDLGSYRETSYVNADRAGYSGGFVQVQRRYPTLTSMLGAPSTQQSGQSAESDSISQAILDESSNEDPET